MRKLIQNPSLKSFHILGPNCVIVHLTRRHAVLDRCYAQGFSILEISKLHMFETYYRDIIPKLGPDTELLMTDTDSWCLLVNMNNKNEQRTDTNSNSSNIIDTPFVFSFSQAKGTSQIDVLSKLRDIMDFSNYHPQHPLYDASRKSIPGFFKVNYINVKHAQSIRTHTRAHNNNTFRTN